MFFLEGVRKKIEDKNLIYVEDTVRCIIKCSVRVVDISPVMCAHQEEPQGQWMVIGNYLQQIKTTSHYILRNQ
jgi:hypothetical protein